MSMNEGAISGDGGNAAPVVNQLPDVGNDRWILELGVTDQSASQSAPLPAVPDTTIPASAGAVQTPTGEEALQVHQDQVADQTAATLSATQLEPPAKVAAPAVAAPVVAGQTAKADDIDAELTLEEQQQIAQLPEANRPVATQGMKRQRLYTRFMNPLASMKEFVAFLQERSPSRAAEMEQVFVEKRMGDPDAFARDLYQRNSELYAKWAMAVYNGAKSFFAELVGGRKGVNEQQIQEALDFHARYKDKVKDEATAIDLADPKTGERLQEMEEYFPEEANLIRQLSDANRTLTATNQQLAAQATPPVAGADPNQASTAAATAAQAIEQEIQELWDLGQDTVINYVIQKASNPKTGIGIHVTPEERQGAPLVAMLRDLKGSVFLDGLTVDGKPEIVGFREGLTVWGKDRKDFVDAILGMDHYTRAREKQNVLEQARSVFPFANTYYDDRLKHPIFTQLDNLITLVATKTNAPPQFDPIQTGGLPAAAAVPGHVTAAGANANSDAYLIGDAVRRAGQGG